MQHNEKHPCGGLARIFHALLETLTSHRLRTRGLRERNGAVVGCLRSRGAWGCDVLTLGHEVRAALCIACR